MIELDKNELEKVAGGGIIDSVLEGPANGAAAGGKAGATSETGGTILNAMTAPVAGGIDKTGSHVITKKIGSGFDGGGGFIGGGISGGGSW